MNNIDWKRVSERLRCPICGDKAHIEPGSDGTAGFHTHCFEITRTLAMQLSQPTDEEIDARIKELKIEMERLFAMRNEKP